MMAVAIRIRSITLDRATLAGLHCIYFSYQISTVHNSCELGRVHRCLVVHKIKLTFGAILLSRAWL